MSERRACRVLGQPRAVQRYTARVRDDEGPLTGRIVELASVYGRYGSPRITGMLRNEGWNVNHKRVERIWRQAGLKVPRKQPRRGRLWLNDGSCVRLRLERKDHVRSDNGNEFTATAVREWLGKVGVKTLYIEPGSPWENGYVESLNGKLRDELLNGEIFYTVAEARVLIERWREHYNRVRPHSALGYRPPAPEAIAAGPPSASLRAVQQRLPMGRTTA